MMAMVRIRIRIHILLLCFGAVCALFANVSQCEGQQKDLPSNGIPYRRVFVPSKDLVHIGLDDFSPIDVKQLEEFIQRHSTFRQPTNEITSDTNGKLQLQSTFYVAKLVGPDLFSERSQLTLVGSPRPGERVSLRPWSLAVSIPTTQGNWIFDEQGAPRIATMPSEQVKSEGEFYQGKYSYPFGWSARADSASTPNNLKFIFEIPKCANSCLVLALPPQAIVQDSLTVARRLDGWGEVEHRLKGWSDLDKEYLRERSPSRSPESLWLIELGGSQSVSFSIALGVGNRPQDDANGLDAHRYRQLIRVQNLEHFVDGQEIRTTCEAEVFVSPEQPWLRMSLEPGSRLRRLTVNQQEVDWKLDDGWIQWSVGPAIKGTSTSASVSVIAEFISPLSLSFEKLGETETPRVSFDHGYVMSGTTVVHSQFPWRLTYVECESSRIAEPTGDSKTAGVNRLEYAWYAKPPSLSIGLERSTQARRCEVLTRLTNEEQGTLAVIRAKLFFGEQDSNQTKLAIAPGWSVRSIHSVDPSDSVTTQYDVETIATASELRLSWDRVQKSRVAELEIRLVRNFAESSGQQRRIRNAKIVQLVDWKQNDTFVLEDSGQFELKLCDALLDDLVTDESIPDWQKSLLPKNGKYYAFRFDSQAPNPSNNKKPKTTQERNSGTLPPDFVWDTKPYRRQASTKTEVDRISSTALQARHEIQLSLSSNRSESVSIDLPSDNVIWRLKEGSKWIPLSPLEVSPELNNLGSGLWHFDLGQKAPECTLLAVVHSELQNDGEVRFPIPRLLSADMLEQEARSLATDVSIESRTVHSTWSIDEEGYKFLKFSDANGDSNIVLTAKVSTPSPLRKWFVIASEYHVAVDTFGAQKASLYFRSNATNQSPFVMELDNDWEPLSVGIRRSSVVQPIPFRIDGRRLVITPELRDLDGEVELHIDLTGPRLSKKSSIKAMGEYFPFRWPELAMDAACVSQQRFLWLPVEMQLAELENKTGVPGQGEWPMWNWSRDVIALLFGYSFSQDPVISANSMISANEVRPSSGLVPQWAAKGWRITRMNSPTLETRTFDGAKSDRGAFRIHRKDIDRSYLVLLFAVVALLTPRLILFRYHVAALAAAFLIVCAHAAPLVAARFAYTGLIGMSASFVVFMIYRLLSNPVNGDKSLSQRHSAKWLPWNDRVGDNESESNHSHGKPISTPRTSAVNMGSLGLCLAMGWTVSSEYSPFAMVAYGQDKSDAGGNAYQIVIPMDEEGNMSGTTAYVPVEMLDVLTGKSERSGQSERGTHPISAKYGLRIGVKGRINSADQITMVYDFLVGDDLAPVRFPINATQLQLARFSVDGNELNLGNKLRSTGFEWIWTPDKPGKRSVQIIAQPLLKFNEPDRNRESPSQSLDIAVLPVGNATMEIETDPKNSFEIVSRGQVTDPAGGRFVAMLGAIDRLQCTLTIPLPKSGSPLSNPSTSVLESGDVPVMHTELFLQNDILQAKTILDFPKGVPVGREIEIEADQQWLPIGTQWGDAEWVESRSGTTLSRRRYVLEWKPPGNANPSSLSPRDRQISVVWVPQSANQSLNVLFAECRDPRTRRGTLRYSRAPGASWSIEGISTWSLAIGSTERLEWPELKTKPLATALRIPSTGGFGVLKPKSPTDKQQQARVTTKWIIDHHRQSLTSRIELLGGSSTAELLVVDVPDDFVVTDFYNRSGPIRYLQSKSNGKLHLQVLADRKSLEVSDLWIQAKRLVSNPSGLIANEEWLELPWIALPSTVNSDQTMEIVASQSIAFRLESESTVIFGEGLNAPALHLAKSYSDIHSVTLAASRYQMIHRKEPLVGSLTVTQNPSASTREIDAVAQLTNSVSSRPFFILEVPASLKDRWQSEARINLIPCPDSSKAWLQVSLPEPSGLEAKTQVSTLVRFVPRIDEPARNSELTTQIRALDSERIPTQRVDALTEVKSEKAMGTQSNATPFDKTTLQLTVAKCILRVRDEAFLVTPTSRFALLESQYWIEATASTSANGALEWQLGDDVEVLSIDVNGQPVDFKQEGQRIHCSLNLAGLCSDVKVFSNHRADIWTKDKMKIDAPKLMGHTEIVEPVLIVSDRMEVMLDGRSIAATEPSIAIGAIAKSCLRILEEAEERWPNAARFEQGSDFDQWKGYWNQKAYRYLDQWSNSVETEEQEAFGLAVKQWHSMQRFFRSPRMEESVVQRNSRLQLLGNSLNAFVEPDATESGSHPARANQWYSLVGCLLILASLTWFPSSLGTALMERPWWCLMALGLFAWLVSGSLLPALVFGSLGLIVAADSYWLVTWRLRRSGIRGPRSL